MNPDNVKAQLEGSNVWAITAAMWGEITLSEGRVQQSNFHDYPVLRMAAVPNLIECHILPWGDTPAGMGEMGIPSLAPALCNAIYNASGVRIRALPIANQLSEALV